MAKTTTDLYRRGNALGPRMTHVRVGKDVLTFLRNGVEFVQAHSGGVSTFAVHGPGRNWWRLPQGSDYPNEISVINDHADHYNWEPNTYLHLSDFVALLARVESAFTKIS